MPQYLDSNGDPIAAGVPDPASALQGAVSYGATQDPDQYAHLLDLQKKLGIPPAVTNGNEQQVQRAADINSIDYPKFAASNPRTTSWGSNPDNAAVSGVDELHRLGGIEQNAANMRSVTPAARTPNPLSDFKDAFLDALKHPIETLFGADTPQAAAEKQTAVHQVADQTGDSFFKSTLALQEMAQKPAYSVSGTGAFQRIFDPQSKNLFSRAMTGGAKTIEALSSPDNLSLFASLPFAPEDASTLISGVFSTQMAQGAASSGYDTIRAAYHGDYGQAAESGAQALVGAAFAAQSGKHALSDRIAQGLAPAKPEAPAPFLGNLAQAIDSAAQSKLRERSPEKFDEALQAIHAGDQSLRIPADQFNSYFSGKGMDPAAIAAGLGSTNYAEAHLSGGDVEIPPADFLSKLDPEHQKALLPDIVDPSTGLTARQHQEGLAAAQEWATGGGAEKLAADTAAADAETASSPEFQEVKAKLLERYTAAGETPEVAETLATKDANVYANLARNAGMKPGELLDLYNPKVTVGEAPGITAKIDEPVDFEKHLADKLAADPQGAIDEYSKLENTDGGRILNTDDARELSEHYRADRTRSSDVHEPASQFIKDLYAKKLAEPVGEGREPLVRFTAGGTGAGKSVGLRMAEGSADAQKADIVYDTNMNNVKSSETKINQALDSGRNVEIQYTYRDPVEALTAGALPRAMRMGRTVPLEDHINTHVGSRKAMDVLQATYKDDPRVTFSGVDNSLGKGNAVEKSIDLLPQVEENGLRERLQNALDEEHRAGRISDAVRSGTERSRRDAAPDASAGSSRGKRGIQPESAAHVEGNPGPDERADGRESEPQRDGRPLAPRDFPHVTTPDELKPYDVARVPIDQLHLDPSRFQYKMNTDASGVTNLLKGRTWNEDLAGVISVWRDPADGKTYVVNGHHRFQLAKETGQGDVAVRMIAAGDAAEARAKGAIQNIAEGRGTAMDAAKFFRDSGATPAQLDRMGVSMGEKTAADGLALAKLDPSLFDQVVNGKLAEGRAVAIGNASSDPADQEAIVKLLDQAEAKGKHVTNETVNEMARMVKGAGQHTETQDGLFGAVEQTHSLVLEKAEVSSYIRKEISTEQRTFASVADEKKAAKLGSVKGQKIDAAANSEIADRAAIARELYDRLSVRSGTVDEILNRASRELADGGKPNDVKTRAYADTRKALAEALTGADRLNSGVAGENKGGSAAEEPADATDAVEVLHQAAKKKPAGGSGLFTESEPAFPGMDHFQAEREQAEANLQRQAIEDRLRSAKGDISGAAGGMERNSPLFYGSGENPSLFGGGSNDEQSSLFQSAGDGTRGWFRVLPDGSYEIGKTKFGDLSTFVHEPAHAYLKIIGDLVRRGGASETLRSDYEKVLEFLGIPAGRGNAEIEFTREQQETWARANEQYLREGKAPSSGLKGTFQRFAIWLGSVYKKASDLGVTLSDDIRGVFDRLYAAEDGVNKADTEAGPKLFTSPEEAGWTDEQFKQYADQNNTSVEQAKAEILGKLNEAAVRERTEAWREEEKNVRTAVTADVDQRPEYTAIRSLRKGALDDGTEITLSHDELLKQFGEARVKELQRIHPGLYRNEGGEEPEIVAEVFGYRSAEEMMRALELAPRRSSAIESATRDYMTAKHGDIRYDGTLPDQSRIALENDSRANGIYRELKALRQSAYDKAPGMRASDTAPIASYREAAQQMIEKKTPSNLQPMRYLDAKYKFARDAADALRRGDAQAAANAKHKELMNHFLFREASNAKEYVGRFEAYAKRVQKTAAQQKLGLAGADYLDQFNRILGRYGLGPQVPAGDRTLAEWASAEYDKGKEPAIDPGILNESRMVNYRSASLAEIRTVHDALINVRALAALELGMTVNGKRVEFQAAISSMDAQAHSSLTTKPTRVLKGNATFGEKISDYAQRGDALLMRTERLMEWMDGGKTGPWHDNLWNHAADSQGNEYKLQEQVTKQIGDALENMPKEQRAKMNEKVTVDGIPETVTRHDLVSMAMNMGNEGNLDRLQKTFIAHGWEPYAIENIKGMLTRAEWQFVQDSWDSLKPLGKAQAELEKRLTGLPPVMVRPTPLDFKSVDGEEMHLAGGYYPVVMDPRFSARGAAQDAGTTAQNLMEAGYGRAATSRGNMKERTGFGGPLQLDYEQVLTQHTAKVIKDITHREFMLAAHKLLLDPQIRKTMRETLGAGYEEKMMPWLRTIVNDRNGSVVQGLGDFSQMIRGLRTNLTLATLSYKISTSLLQWTHAPRMLLSTNPGSYAQAMVDFMAHPSDMTEQIKGLSPNEMAFRGDNLDRDIRETLRGDPGIKRNVARVGNLSIKYTDHILSFPLWLSVYRDALKEHVDLPEDRAKYLATHAADSAVRLGLGSGAPKDLPPIMRSNDLSKLLTMFYSFHNGIYGQVRDIGHQYSQKGGVGKLTYGLALSVLVPAVLSGIVSGNGPKDDENKGAWAAKRALLFGADTVPVVRDAANALDSDGEVKNPLVNVLSKGTKATQEAMSDKDDKDWNGIGLNYLEVGGDLAGVPGTTQALKPFRYMNQVQKGNVENPNVWDAMAGSAHR